MSHYDILYCDVAQLSLLRHNENMTFRVVSNFILQIHEHTDGFDSSHICSGINRTTLRETEYEFFEHLKERGMTIREPVKNRDGRMITKLNDGTTATVSRWLEGESLDKIPINAEILRLIGTLTAQLHKNAKGFNPSCIVRYDGEHCRRLTVSTAAGSRKNFAHLKITA